MQTGQDLVDRAYQIQMLGLRLEARNKLHIGPWSGGGALTSSSFRHPLALLHGPRRKDMLPFIT